MSKNGKYIKKTARVDAESKSYFDKYPTLTVNRYWIPKGYLEAVSQTISFYRSGIPFNKAVDEAHKNNPTLKRNKIAEHTLKRIANDN